MIASILKTISEKLPDIICSLADMTSMKSDPVSNLKHESIYKAVMFNGLPVVAAVKPISQSFSGIS